MKGESAHLVLPAALAAWAVSSSPSAAQPIAGMSQGQTVALIATGLLVVFGAVGGYLLYIGLRNRRLARESALWPTTGGTVITSDVSKRTSRDRKRKTTSTSYKPTIRYSYSVAGHGFECEVIRFGSLEGGSYQKAKEIVTPSSSWPSSR